MKTWIFALALTPVFAGIQLLAQTVTHPQHSMDAGGGLSTSGGVTLRTSIGQHALQGGSTSGFNLEGGFIPVVRGIILPANTMTVGVPVASGWNMISVPLTVNDYTKTTLYPTAASEAFAFQGSYIAQAILSNGIGYWLNFTTPQDVLLTGFARTQQTIAVAPGWNMIGSISSAVPVATVVSVPPGNVVSNYIGFAGSYVTTSTLQPGQGYWVNVQQNGQLVLSSGNSPKETPAELLPPSGTLTLQDAAHRSQTLLVGTDQRLSSRQYELPPVPPVGVFDVRFSSGRMAEGVVGTAILPLALSSVSYPITVTWSQADSLVATLVVGTQETSLRAGVPVTIEERPSGLSVRITSIVGSDLPREFSLQQNYPDPFNPSTTIRYQLPEAAHVTLKVYDILGREVVTLMDAMQDAGYKSVVWDAANVASGIYFSRITATSGHNLFTDVRKMLVVK